jgi:hypothetical protein
MQGFGSVPGIGASPSNPQAAKTHLADLDGESPAVMPLVLLGDVNEDGVVDASDQEEVCDYVDSGGAVAVSCPAAADLDLDGEITENDHALMKQMVASGVKSPALYAQPTLPCAYKSLQFGATDVLPGEPTLIRLFRGLTTQTVQAKTDAPVQLVAAEDGKGFEVVGMDAIAPGTDVTVSLTTGGQERFLTLSKAAVDDVKIQDFGAAFNEDGSTPTYDHFHGDVDGGETCPAATLGCQVLIIDFGMWVDEKDSSQTSAAFTAAGCNVVEAWPFMRPLPKSYTVNTIVGPVTIPPDPAKVAAVKASNGAEWAKVADKIRTHRQAVAKGANLAVQILSGHGSHTGCGTVGPKFSTGAGVLGRASFHAGNYAAESHSVCSAAAMDWTCSGGLSVKAVQSLDNTGAASCSVAPPISHPLHAGYYADMAMSLAPAGSYCTDAQVGVEDTSLSNAITMAGATKNPALIAKGIRDRIPSSTMGPSQFQGYYTDKGYNSEPSNKCEDGDHVAVY